jgi:hypothetical protein
MLSVVEIAREKSAFGMSPFEEDTGEEPTFSTKNGYSESAIDSGEKEFDPTDRD